MVVRVNIKDIFIIMVLKYVLYFNVDDDVNWFKWFCGYLLVWVLFYKYYRIMV